MFKILIWDYTGISAQWLKQAVDMKYIEVVRTIKPKEHLPEIFFDTNEWDWLLIFEQGMRDFFNTAIKMSRLPPERVIYALDLNSWRQRPKAAFALTDMHSEIGATIFLNLNCEINRRLNNFVTCTAEGLNYVAPSTDSFRMPNMSVNRVNWASQDMKRFHALAKKYYGVDDGAGYFLDLGANIGTTGLYFVKKLAPKLKLLAVEPDPENFKMHRVNAILNDLDAATDLVNCGLGNEFDELMLYRNGSNPGANSFIKREHSTPIATVKIMPLDACLAEHNIVAQEVKYIWIATEGFEPQVLLGAKNLLLENPAPIFMECNLRAWDKSGCFDDMMALLAEGYSHFIRVQGDGTIYPLDALRTLERPNNPLGQIGDIFLIRKGAID